MKKYKPLLYENTFSIPSYMRFAGSKFKPYEQLLFASAIDFYLEHLIGSKRHSIKLRIIPKDNLMKGTFANVLLTAEAMNNHIFDLNINRNAGTKAMLHYLAHEITHVAQIVNKDLSTQDFKVLQWKGSDIVSNKEYSKLRQKDIDAYFAFPHEKEAEENFKHLPELYLKSKEFKNLKGIDPTLDLIVGTL